MDCWAVTAVVPVAEVAEAVAALGHEHTSGPLPWSSDHRKGGTSRLAPCKVFCNASISMKSSLGIAWAPSWRQSGQGSTGCTAGECGVVAGCPIFVSVLRLTKVGVHVESATMLSLPLLVVFACCVSTKVQE